MDVGFFTRLRIALMRRAVDRTDYIIKKKLFAGVGKNFEFVPRIVPVNAEFIKFHDNDVVASDVKFINHDAVYRVYNGMDTGKKCRKKYGCIEIMDNVFIGSKSTILYGVRIGPNAIVAAGSLVNKDVPPGTVVGGVPAKVIGNFDELCQRYIDESDSVGENGYSAKECWKRFYEARGENTEVE
ncbi:MAG: acyltransferase [Oscillospiraceae bacterium]|nr:acyltransferase [Oscillospiraceae bacterium]